ncbi:NUDIX domain-containing protein [Nonomuraea sp. NPDC049400]|uniref:NUDIX domain-containing protein n=1 Tax=Nonomuraea sp. NPDC049400 TaxID=3364352 RepID=UPI00378F806C
MVSRPSARVVLVDGINRLLLFSSHDEHDGTVRWYTPGGGLRRGESHRRGSIRRCR